MKTFKHSGDLGDIILSLPAVSSMGGGVLYLDPQGGEREDLVSWATYTRTKLSEEAILSLKPVLEKQSYIKEVRLWNPSIKVDYNLDEFRKYVNFNNLTTSHLEAFNLRHKMDEWQTNKWIEVEPKKLPNNKNIILSRSCRYHSNYSFWESLGEEYITDAVFISHPEEFEYFLYTFPRYKGLIEYLDTTNVVELAGYIQGCDLFIGNQSFTYCLAEAMKKKLVLEVYKTSPSSLFKREDAQYV